MPTLLSRYLAKFVLRIKSIFVVFNNLTISKYFQIKQIRVAPLVYWTKKHKIGWMNFSRTICVLYTLPGITPLITFIASWTPQQGPPGKWLQRDSKSRLLWIKNHFYCLFSSNHWSKCCCRIIAQRRTLVTATKPKLGDHHGPHTVFDGKPFKKSQVIPVVWGVTFLGFAIPMYAVYFQNKKHGFPQK